MKIKNNDRIIEIEKLDRNNEIIIEIIDTRHAEIIDMSININQIAELSKFLQEQLNAYAEANSPKITSQMIIDEFNKVWGQIKKYE